MSSESQHILSNLLKGRLLSIHVTWRMTQHASLHNSSCLAHYRFSFYLSWSPHTPIVSGNVWKPSITSRNIIFWNKQQSCLPNDLNILFHWYNCFCGKTILYLATHRKLNSFVHQLICRKVNFKQKVTPQQIRDKNILHGIIKAANIWHQNPRFNNKTHISQRWRSIKCNYCEIH